MDALWRPAYVAIGSNLDQPRERVLEACERIWRPARRRGSSCARACTCTRPMGPQDQPDFVNAAAGLLTQMGARELLDGVARNRATHGAHPARALGAAAHRPGSGVDGRARRSMSPV